MNYYNLPANLAKRAEFKAKLEVLFDEYDVVAGVHIQDGNPFVKFMSPDFNFTNHQMWKPVNTCKYGNPSDKPDPNCSLFYKCTEHPKD